MSSSPLFYHPGLKPEDGIIQLEEETRRHVFTVLRMSVGEMLVLTNGRGLSAEAEIVQADKKQLKVACKNYIQHSEPVQKLLLGISLLKNAARFEWMLEKVTEIGITEIVPLLTERTERQHFRKDRFEQILISASLQSQRFHFPVLHDPVRLEDCLTRQEISNKYIAHCMNGHREKLTGGSSDGILLIGPEGDFTPEELSMAEAKGYTPVTLGDSRLRTETAGIVGAVMLRG